MRNSTLHVCEQRLDALGLGHEFVQRALEIDGLGAEITAQHEIVEIEDLAEPGREPVTLHEVGQPHRAARNLVLVRRADAAPGGADGIDALRTLARAIERNVRRQDHRAVGTDFEPVVHGDAALDQHVGLAKQRFERDHDTVADQALHVVVQDAGGDQRQDGLHALDDERMAGVVAALEARDRADPLGEQVHDLAFAFVAPLGADDD